jgi:hypothetical protein
MRGLKARHYLFAPMEYMGRIAIIKITVKEYHREENKLYSIEALDIEAIKKGRWSVTAWYAIRRSTSIPLGVHIFNIGVNRQNVKR